MKMRVKPCNKYKSNRDDNSCCNCGHDALSHKMRKEFIEKDYPLGTTHDMTEYIFSSLSCTEKLTKEFIKQTFENIKLFDKKQRDYGSGNIARFGEQGVLIRISDKFERLVTLSNIIKDSSTYDWNTSTNESIEDTWQDISNYATIALLTRKGVWPKY